MSLFVLFRVVATKLIYEVSSCFRSVCELRMTIVPGFVGSFLALFFVKPFCYLRENVTGGILTTCIMMRLSRTDFVSLVGRI